MGADPIRRLVQELSRLPGIGEKTATRLAFRFRDEARNDRNLLVLAAEGELEPELCARLESLCRRRT